MPRTILGLVLLVSLSAACANQGETVPGPTGPSSPTVTSVTVAGSLSLSNVGETSQMTATAHYAKGTTENVTGQARWSSSDATVATVSGGLVTAAGIGTATVTATYKDVSGSTRVTVTRPPSFVLTGQVTESVPHTSIAIAGVRVEVVDGSNKGKFGLSDASGRYQIADLEGGSFEVRATISGYTAATRQVVLAANLTADFALVPTVQQMQETIAQVISGSDYRCYADKPCRTIDVPLHNTGLLTASVTWGGDADLWLELYNVDTRSSVALSAIPGARPQSLSQTVSAPGNYQLRVIGGRLGTAAIAFTLYTTHTN